MARKLWMMALLAATSAGGQEPEGTVQAEQASAAAAQTPAENASGPQDGGGSDSTSQDTGGVKTLSVMSILGNEEAPKSLVIVPWKSSQLGDEVGVSNGIDERARPVDREVFMRELHYYELRSGG